MNSNPDPMERRVDIVELASKVAVLESKIERMSKEMDDLSNLLKEHMEKEEQERKEIMARLEAISLAINNQANLISNYRGIVFGVTKTVAIIFTIITLGVTLINKLL